MITACHLRTSIANTNNLPGYSTPSFIHTQPPVFSEKTSGSAPSQKHAPGADTVRVHLPRSTACYVDRPDADSLSVLACVHNMLWSGMTTHWGCRPIMNEHTHANLSPRSTLFSPNCWPIFFPVLSIIVSKVLRRGTQPETKQQRPCFRCASNISENLVSPHKDRAPHELKQTSRRPHALSSGTRLAPQGRQ